MSEKENLLANMSREDLIKIIGAEKERLAKRGIELAESSDDDTLRRVLETLNVRTIRKHAQKLDPSLIRDPLTQ